MANAVPYEVIAGPGTIYLAPTGTAFPTSVAAPAVAWVKLGSNGDLNYDGAAGISVEMPQEVTSWKPLGSTAPRKFFRTDSGLMVKVKVVDMTLEQIKVALNGNTVTDTAAGAGTVGHRKIGLSRGVDIVNYAMLLRINLSPYGSDATWTHQYEIPIVFQTGSPTVVYKQGEPAGYELEFQAVEDAGAASADERFGVLRAVDAAAV